MKILSSFGFLVIAFFLALLYLQFMHGLLWGNWTRFEQAQKVFQEFGIYVLVITGVLVGLVLGLQFIYEE